MRKLASIQILNNLEPIENSDFLSKATVLGWQTVVKRSEYPQESIGSKIVWVEIDSILPEEQEWADFMRPKKFRVKTCKLRGVLSQGIVFPLSILPEGLRDAPEDTDLTDTLCIKKYESHDSSEGSRFKQGNSEGNFPVEVPKTDETRIQSCLACLYELQEKPYVITLKYDGTSATYLYSSKEDKFYCCSRNYDKKPDPSNIYWDIANRYNLQEKLKEFPDLAIQGEICGPGIQGNKLELKEPDLFVFTVYDTKEQRRLSYDNLRDICFKLGISPAKCLEGGNSFWHTKEFLLEYADDYYPNTKNYREGFVVRAEPPIYSNKLQGPLSFKVISNKYLLKEE